MTGLVRFFEAMEDPRRERTKRHNFKDILSITIAAVICGCEDWNEIELFECLKQDWLSTFWNCPMAYLLTIPSIVFLPL